MIIIQQQIGDKVTAEIEVTSQTKFLTRCEKCRAPVEATHDIIKDFLGFYINTTGIICEKCSPYKKIYYETPQEK